LVRFREIDWYKLPTMTRLLSGGTGALRWNYCTRRADGS